MSTPATETPGSTTPPPATTPAPQTQPRGYFNRAQLEDLKLAENLHQQALKAPHATALATRDLDAPWLTASGQLLTDARSRITATGQASDQRKAATLNADGAERALVLGLQGIQSAAKQKRRMALDAGGDFPLDGYLIGERLNPNHATLLQNADTLLAKAQADALPGYKTADALKPVADALQAFRDASDGQDTAGETASTDRLDRDKLIARINARRLALQHAIDGLHPYTDDANAPARRLFGLPTDRPFNG